MGKADASEDFKPLSLRQLLLSRNTLPILTVLKEENNGKGLTWTEIQRKMGGGRIIKQSQFSSFAKSALFFKLVTKDQKIYKITENGILVLERMIGPIKALDQSALGPTIPFEEPTDDRRPWVNLVSELILKSSECVRFTAFHLESLSKKNLQRKLVFEALEFSLSQLDRKLKSDTRINVKAIFDPTLPEETLIDLSELFKKHKVNFEHVEVPKGYFEDPKGILKPIFPFVKNALHLFVTDDRHWLWIEKDENGLHKGAYGYDNQLIAKYLVDLFEAYWDLGLKHKTVDKITTKENHGSEDDDSSG